MQTVTIAAAFKNTACKFIYNLNLSVANKIVNFYFIKSVSAYSLSKIMNVFKVFFIKNRTFNNVVLQKE